MAILSTRCKFACTAIEKNESSSGAIVSFDARYCPEVSDDVRFSRYTPWGTVRIGIDNPVAMELMKVGQQYYFDITPVEGE